jgi:Transposase
VAKDAKLQNVHAGLAFAGGLVKGMWGDPCCDGSYQRLLATGLLVNPQHIKAVPGRKTDTKDCEWIADLLQHGLLKGSFVPPTAIQDWRDLTRYRAELRQSQNRVANRIQKLLEQANLKLSSVVSNTLAVSGRLMLEAIIAAGEDAQKLAQLTRGRLKTKIPQLKQALEGRVREHHRFLLAEYLNEWDSLGGSDSPDLCTSALLNRRLPCGKPFPVWSG